MNFRRSWKWQGDHFMASSASMIVRTLKPLGYRSVVVDWNNIVLLDERNYCEVARFSNGDLDEQYALGYRDRIGREQIFSWNAVSAGRHLRPGAPSPPAPPPLLSAPRGRPPPPHPPALGTLASPWPNHERRT